MEGFCHLCRALPAVLLLAAGAAFGAPPAAEPSGGSAAGGPMRPAEMAARDFSDFPFESSPDDLAFRLFAIRMPREPLYIQKEGEYKRLQPVPQGLSQTHYHSGGRRMDLFVKDVDEAGEVVFNPVARIEFPSSSREWIVLLDRRGPRIVAEPLDRGPDGQPMNTIRFLNATPANLHVQLGPEVGMVPAGSSLDAGIGAESMTFFNFKVAVRYEGEPRLIYTNRHPFGAPMRMLFLGYSVSGGGGGGEMPFQVFALRDRGPERVAEADGES